MCELKVKTSALAYEIRKTFVQCMTPEMIEWKNIREANGSSKRSLSQGASPRSDVAKTTTTVMVCGDDSQCTTPTTPTSAEPPVGCVMEMSFSDDKCFEQLRAMWRNWAPLHKVFEYLDKCYAAKIYPTSRTFAYVIKFLAWEREPRFYLDKINELFRRVRVQNVHSWSSLVRAYCSMKMWDEMEYAFETARGNLIPGSKDYQYRHVLYQSAYEGSVTFKSPNRVLQKILVRMIEDLVKLPIEVLEKAKNLPTVQNFQKKSSYVNGRAPNKNRDRNQQYGSRWTGSNYDEQQVDNRFGPKKRGSFGHRLGKPESRNTKTENE